MNQRTVYMDHAATTPLQPEALQAMLPYLGSDFGNPSGSYRLARRAYEAVERARRQVAAVLACRPNEVVFTSGGTESINTAIKGVAPAQRLTGAGNHIVTSTAEHHAVLHTCQYLEKFGFEVTYAPVDSYGLVEPDAVAEAITGQTVLVSIMLANNEVGTIQPIGEIAAAVKERGRRLGKRIPFHTDAVQGPGLLSLLVAELGVDLLSLSAHKFGGPKGVGALYVRRAVPFLAQQSGGGQERQRRAGTENVAGNVGMGLALTLAAAERERHVRILRRLRDRLIGGIRERVEGAELMGHPEQRLANNVHFAFEGVAGDALVAALDARGIAASAGSACATATWEPSHVLLAMGVPLPKAVGGLRLTLGPQNADDDVDYVLAVLPAVVEKLRAGVTTSARR
ncbi:MAG: cysteine desulfurase family protein [Dehalococcoidia bacterium]